MKNKKTLIWNLILIILIISFLVVLGIIIKNIYTNYINEKNIKNIISEVEEKLEENDNGNIYFEYEGFQVIGLINISKIDLHYPILSETTEESMKKSVTRFFGGQLNEIGNVTLSAHNNIDGTMFGKIKTLELKDTIEIIDLSGKTSTYEIFDIYVTDPDDIDCLVAREPERKEITLITCTNGNKNRLILKAYEI